MTGDSFLLVNQARLCMQGNAGEDYHREDEFPDEQYRVRAKSKRNRCLTHLFGHFRAVANH